MKVEYEMCTVCSNNIKAMDRKSQIPKGFFSIKTGGFFLPLKDGKCILTLFSLSFPSHTDLPAWLLSVLLPRNGPKSHQLAFLPKQLSQIPDAPPKKTKNKKPLSQRLNYTSHHLFWTLSLLSNL